MMKKICGIITLLLWIASVNAFSPTPSLTRLSISSRRWAASLNEEDSASTGEDPATTATTAFEVNQEVREELIAKYMEMGKSRELAENEIDEFLQDPEQSRKYLEMRAYAQSQADLLGPELYLQFFGYFMLGVIGTVGPKYYHALYPDGGGPIPFL
mmetsp:Transcript_3573/g.6086  ORF Transcript_3573/g.6086 Transcript_3573/m.6086 type:complete len:156 (-) Transcript_3573:209-676(-)